ncbi:superoxide dismutase, Cu-Zn family [Streptoalloteichus tenebrarius]|uniref:Superoxide dismutase, Cu-Zn family n=1 Tax=Streptoalloteichus tenebrarius (strain ATCC 17920 / DSM 40477 / JCM 4838 / CBS 697.72 / NBRC 16177 / NCIMB 11028 / NRRL B-12390 / A12253. 1 / ISP 5477) TaxID=1933 RepID=A0ABT1HV37_STRSD|nr:superoxide dismutase [Streptoalloteichus tenebrarius]MCP2259398.1 superoxide dismutase, Cu-Zn family [Streptoalloteichus tenebrarius]
MRRKSTIAALFGMGAALTLLTTTPAVASTEATAAGGSAVIARGTFEPYRPGATAITYNQELARPGSRATVVAFPAPNNGTRVVLLTQGLVPHREYGAHAHVNACGATGAAAGPHYQNVVDPKPGTSTDPAYANPRNEIWLDFTTDREGNGFAMTTVPWRFTDRHAGSVVIHEHHTHTDPGHAGQAGDRLACITVPF